MRKLLLIAYLYFRPNSMGVYFGNAKVFLKLLDQVDQIAFHLRSLNTIIDDV